MEVSDCSQSTIKHRNTRIQIPDDLDDKRHVIISLTDSAFNHFKARYLILVFSMVLVIPFLFVTSTESPTVIALRQLVYFILAGLVLYAFSKVYSVDIKRLFISSGQRINYLRLTVGYVFPLVCFSLASLWLVYYPLTIIWPDYIESRFSSSIQFVHWSEGEFLWGINTIYFVFLCVFYPFIEELLFRGYLLNRWGKKWTVQKAAILSSLMFGLLHPNVIGAALLGYVLCVLYIQTKNLWVPIVVHGLNNVFGWFLEFANTFGGKAKVMPFDLQQEIWVGLICIVVSIFWLMHFLRKDYVKIKWELPYGT